MKKLGGSLAMLMALGGCASIVSGSTQEIQLKANPSVPIKCEAQNDRGLYTSNDQPGMLLVKRSQSRLNITCNGNGYKGKYSEQAGAEAWTFGNVIAGGVIGLTIDGITGAMFSYDNALLIPVTANVPPIQSGMPAPVDAPAVSAPVAPSVQAGSPCAGLGNNANYPDLVSCGAIVGATNETQHLVTAPVQKR